LECKDTQSFVKNDDQIDYILKVMLIWWKSNGENRKSST